jgi:hypothetical protein
MAGAVSHAEQPLTAAEARSLTDQVKADAAALWAKLLELHDGGAHTALGYKSWGAYCAAEFDIGKSRAYQLLNAGRVVAALEGQSTVVDSITERQARELVPLVDDPDGLLGAWQQSVADHGPTPTAAQVQALVRRDQRTVDSPGVNGSPSKAAVERVIVLEARFKTYAQLLANESYRSRLVRDLEAHPVARLADFMRELRSAAQSLDALARFLEHEFAGPHDAGRA